MSNRIMFPEENGSLSVQSEKLMKRAYAALAGSTQVTSLGLIRELIELVEKLSGTRNSPDSPLRDVRFLTDKEKAE